jgi:diaminopimelate decarboxylase
MATAPGFSYGSRALARRASLLCEAVPVARLAQRFGTPLYVYSASLIRARYEIFDAALAGVPHTVCYSVKANSNLSLLKMLAVLGSGFDVVSGGELQRVQRADKRAVRKVVFSGVGKTVAEIDAALRAGILLFNVESESELQVLAERAAKLRKRAPVALRVNPDVPAETHPYISTGLHKHKFGVPVETARKLYKVAISVRRSPMSRRSRLRFRGSSTL